MSLLRVILGSYCVVIALSWATVQAEQFEFVIADRAIKQTLLSHELNFDDAWAEVINDDNEIDEDKLAQLSQQVTTIFTKITIEPPLTTVPSDEQTWKKLIKRIRTDDEQLEEHFDNIQLFNDLLEQYTVSRALLVPQEDPSKLFQNLLKHIALAICTYLDKEAIEDRLEENSDATKDHLHLYIKFVYDSQTNNITFKTAPHAAQNGFERTYTKVQYIKEAPTGLRPEKESCCFFSTKLLGLSAIFLGILAAGSSYLNTLDQEQFEEFFKYFSHFDLSEQG